MPFPIKIHFDDYDDVKRTYRTREEMRQVKLSASILSGKNIFQKKFELPPRNSSHRQCFRVTVYIFIISDFTAVTF